MRRSCLYALAAATALASPAYAQEALDQVVVTAQKREQSLQNVPVSVTVLQAQGLADAGVRDIKDLAVVVPGLLAASTSNPTYTTFRIRGVGTVGDNPGLESSVGVVVDGVYRPRNGVALTDLGELDRVEVLKGPQGTLFGKNTSAGVVNVMTARPSFDFGWNAEASYGNYDAYTAQAAVTGPISSTVAGRLYAGFRKRDGLYSVSTGSGPRTDRRDDDQDVGAARAQLLIVPNAKAQIRLIADYSKRDENCCVGVSLNVGPTAAYLKGMAPDGGVAQVADPFSRRTFWNRGTQAHITDGGLSAEADLELGPTKLTSITAFREWTARLGQDWDFTSADIAYRPDDGSFSNRFSQFSQELRLAGTSGRLDWLVGGFYGREDLDRRDSLLYGADYERYLGLLLSGGTDPNRVASLTGLPSGASYRQGAGLIDSYSQSEETAALFTHDTLKLTDQFELSVGLRWTSEKKAVAALYPNTDGAAGCAAAIARNAASQSTLCLPWSNPAFNNLTQLQSLSEDAWSGTAQALYHLTPGVSAYASYARGYKAPGFNLDRSQTGLVPDASTAFPAEKSDAFELGIKEVLLGGRLRINTALFHTVYKDFQLNSFLGTTFTVRSVPRVTSKGAETEFALQGPIEGLTLNGGATFAQTEYGQAVIAGLPRLPGTRLSFAPLWSGTLGGAYQHALGGNLVGRASLEAKYSSAYNTGSDLDPLKVQKAYTVVNARIGFGAASGAWTLEAWAKNLFDKDYIQVAYGAPFQTGTIGAFLAPPRLYGLTLRLKG
jgi:outer membrane receptor protein involved in Fe transport